VHTACAASPTTTARFENENSNQMSGELGTTFSEPASQAFLRRQRWAESEQGPQGLAVSTPARAAIPWVTWAVPESPAA